MGDGTLFLGGDLSEGPTGSILMAAAWGGEGEKRKRGLYDFGIRRDSGGCYLGSLSGPGPGRGGRNDGEEVGGHGGDGGAVPGKSRSKGG